MNPATFCLRIGELNVAALQLQRKMMLADCLHYCPPSAGGWSVIYTGLLVPEAMMLFVAPAGCGRHGAIAGIQLGYKKRLCFLYLDETDIVTGQHMLKIPQAVAEIMATARPRPKALLICATCIDDLLGSDYDGLARQLEMEHGLPVRACRMDPIAKDGKTPAQLTVQAAIYDFLRPTAEKERAVNIIGSFAAIDAGSELYDVMAAAGIGSVRHVAACSGWEEFQSMSRASHNIIIKPAGQLAARRMQQKHGVPSCFVPVAYGLEAIARNYRAMEEFLGIELHTDEYRIEAEAAIKHHLQAMGPLSVAVGSAINASPFELSRALTEYGFNVRYVFADLIRNFEAEHVEWLKHHAPHIEVFTNVHPTMVDFRRQGLTVDLAIGFDAGYFCSEARTAPLTLDYQPYGYRGVIYLLRQMLNALEHPANHREQMYAFGLVI